MKIVTEYYPKPVPTTEFDWLAWEDGQEELGSGHGSTEQEAINDLKNFRGDK